MIIRLRLPSSPSAALAQFRRKIARTNFQAMERRRRLDAWLVSDEKADVSELLRLVLEFAAAEERLLRALSAAVHGDEVSKRRSRFSGGVGGAKSGRKRQRPGANLEREIDALKRKHPSLTDAAALRKHLSKKADWYEGDDLERARRLTAGKRRLTRARKMTRTRKPKT